MTNFPSFPRALSRALKKRKDERSESQKHQQRLRGDAFEHLTRVANQFRGKYDIRNKRTLVARGASESADRFSGVIVASETRPGEFLTGG
jgi:hypothetical protein